MSDWESAPSVIDDNTRKFLDFLGKAEGADYNTIVGGKSFNDFSAHPNVVGLRTKEGPSTAAGKYQILKSTYDDVAPKLGITDFSPESQDRIALELIKRKGALEDIQKGDYNSAIGKLGGTWASLPSSPYQQPKRSAQWVQKALDTIITPAYAGEAPNRLPTITVPAAQAAPAASSDDGWEAAPTKVATPAPAPDDWESATSPAPVAGSSPKPAPIGAPAAAPKSVLRRVDDFVRGVADTATFGYADEIAAGLDRFFGINTGKQGAAPKNYDEALAAQRALDKEGGGERIAGQVGGALVPGAGVLNAARAPATASRLARAGAGAATGAAQGALYGSGSAEGDLGDRVSNAITGGAIGAVTGGVIGGALPSTAKQEAGSIIKKAGSDRAAAMDAEIIRDINKVAGNATQREMPVGAVQLNALENKYIGDVQTALKGIGKRNLESIGLKADDISTAVRDRRIIGEDALNALRTSNAGTALADAIEKAQRARSLTAAVPAATNPLARVGRATLDLLPIPQPLRYVGQRVLGSRQTREDVAQKLISGKQADAAEEVLSRLGPSAATQSLESVQQMGQKLQAMAQARAQAQAQAAAQQSAKDAATRLQVLQDTRMPLGGAFQELLPGGRANTNLGSREAIEALRTLKRKGGAVGDAAAEVLASKPVSNTDAFYGLQNAVRGLQEKGVAPSAPGILSGGGNPVRNPISYAEAVRTAGEAANMARTAAPSKELAQFATKVAGTKAPADKVKLLQDRLGKTTDPNEIAFLNNFIEPLTRFGAK